MLGFDFVGLKISESTKIFKTTLKTKSKVRGLKLYNFKV